MTQKILKTKKAIAAWLAKYNIEEYMFERDENYGYSVEVYTNVDLSNKNLTFIPIKFRFVSGSLDVSHNQLTSLEFCPELVKYTFDFRNNQIASWEFFPEQASNVLLYNNPNLGAAQEIEDFKTLTAIRQEWLQVQAIKKELNLLNQELKVDNTIAHTNQLLKI